MRLAVIPARGGSKRIPRKNIRNFEGKPLLYWAVSAALKSELFDKIIVSTDDDEIAEVAHSVGADVPFRRPEHLSNDYAGTTEVIAHATEWAIATNMALDSVCCIYANPFVTAEDLVRGAAAIEQGEWSYVFSATEFSSTIYRSFIRLKSGGVEMVFPDAFKSRSQDLPVTLHDAAQFYFGRPSAWTSGSVIFAAHSCPIVIPRWRVQDIDDEGDWRRAELLWRQLDDTAASV